MTDNANISTENQPKGAARNPSDTLDKPKPDQAKQAPETDDTRPKAGD